MKNVDEALKIIAKEPLPKDAREQVDALYEKASDDEKPLFDMVYEGLVLGEDGSI